MKRVFVTAVLALSLGACITTTQDANTAAKGPDMNSIAERYVKLVLAIGQHDADYVDAFYGPQEWKAQADAAGKRPLDEIAAEIDALRKEAAAVNVAGQEELVQLRRQYLARQLEAMAGRVSMLRGTKLSFDEESRVLYDAVAPTHDAAYFENLLQQLDRELPGDGTTSQRLEEFRKGFIVPREKLDAVFRRAVEGCRERTLQHMELPPGESFTIEYVTNKSWSGYNWYQGNYRSLIQVNTDLPIFIDRAVDLACHEGYPGHHVYNVLLEKALVRDRGWVEFSVYPLFSPQSLIAEGSANYGIEVAFPKQERVEFERRELFPLAGLDSNRAEQYDRVMALTAQLSYAGNEAARGYLDGKLTADQAVDWLVRYALMEPARARQRLRFFDQYRSYTINYNLGKDLVQRHVEARGGTDSNPAKRWEEFKALLSSPRLPSGLSK